MNASTNANADVASASCDGQAEWTIGRLLKWTHGYLARHDVDEARLAAEVLLSRAAKCRRIDLYTRFDEPLGEAALDRFREWARRAAAKEPIAYLVEEKEFFSLSFRVTRDVLIPRPETELLVERVLDHCEKVGLSQPRLLDLGTGSGCVVVAVLSQLDGAGAVATDVSPAALEIARFNAKRHSVLDRLALVEADRLMLPEQVVPDGGFNVLMSNPPYVPADTMGGLDAAVRDHEPTAALTDGGDGLSFYRSVAADAPRMLAPEGAVFVEVGDGRAATVIATVEETGMLVHLKTWKDQVTGHERVLMFSLEKTPKKAKSQEVEKSK